MVPLKKPTLTLTASTLTCSIGSYTATPTSSIFSLFVDGKHISTIFSALGDLLPDWIAPWATPGTITRTATLTSATWANSAAYAGKKLSCSSLAYSNHATGLISSDEVVG
jgi:hypothetical protein